MTWHLLTGEYPACRTEASGEGAPASGGVGDYTRAVARALVARGEQVQVWSPALLSNGLEEGVHLRALPDRFGKRSRSLLEAEWKQTPGVVLLQYVPNALGAGGLNLPFCGWLQKARRTVDVRVMFHEPYFYFSWNPAGNVRALVQRLMARRLVHASRVVYLSTETWRRYLPLPNTPSLVLPVPSTIPRTCDPSAVKRIQGNAGRGPGTELAGHFGTYGDHVARALEPVIALVLRSRPRAHFLCIGRNSGAFAGMLRGRHSPLAQRIHATGELLPSETAAAIRACDVVVQPYPDGVTTRRTSVMAPLANGVAIVTTVGSLTERIWRDTGAVALARAGDAGAINAEVVRLLEDAAARSGLAAAGRRAYDRHFSLEKSIDVLLASR